MSGAATLFCAALLIVSALHKLLARERLASSTARLVRLPQPLGMPLLLVTALCELCAASALLIPGLKTSGALGAAALWSAYGLALWSKSGQVIDCGCDLFSREKAIDGLAIARPWFLAILASWLALQPASTTAQTAVLDDEFYVYHHQIN
jgi:uncharacterized membrane protein YphA (DoxX/SURF4 family)